MFYTDFIGKKNKTKKKTIFLSDTTRPTALVSPIRLLPRLVQLWPWDQTWSAPGSHVSYICIKGVKKVLLRNKIVFLLG